MNIYRSLNEITNYIDDHLEEAIDYERLAKIMGVSKYIMLRIFSMLAGITLSEYIRKRRLSNAGYDLYSNKCKVVDIAVKYQYDNPTSFSRAFYKFHGIKPSEVSKKTKLKNFPRIVFDEKIKDISELDYEIITLDKMDLYGLSISTNNKKIGSVAPKIIKDTTKQYGPIKYGMITYDEERGNCTKYHCLYDIKIAGFEHISIPKSRWLRFEINSRDAKEIQALSHKFYSEFLPSCKYKLKPLPELEYYHDDKTDFLVAIY